MRLRCLVALLCLCFGGSDAPAATKTTKKGKASLHPMAAKMVDSCRKEMLQNKLSKAENYCKLALRYDPRSVEAHLVLGQLELRRNRLTQAESWLKKALVLDKRCVEAYDSLGVVYYRRRAHKRALSLFGKALHYNPKMRSAGYNRARVLIALRRPKQARAQIIRSLLFPKNRSFAPFHFLLGYIAFSGRRYKSSVKYWLTALRYNAKDAKTQLNLCKALYMLRRYGAACYHCKQALQLQPKHVASRRSLKAVKEKLRQVKKRCHTSTARVR